jgi:glyoxylase-like metal-dependent hydrolase (beta-lactamase superfamily II)
MPQEITTISTSLGPIFLVNCYLLRSGDGFILIDSGNAGKRRAVEAAIENAGCKPGNLKLIILTHGDFDHCGNAAYLREKFGSKIALHRDDTGIAERGDLSCGRKSRKFLIKLASSTVYRLSKSDQFKPDLYIDENTDLSAYGFDGKVLQVPGHTKGSVGILMANGDLFCGDLLANRGKPTLWLPDDMPSAQASIEKLKTLPVKAVYPGHGTPFSLSQFLANAR